MNTREAGRIRIPKFFFNIDFAELIGTPNNSWNLGE
jgi:hypothetical protein